MLDRIATRLREDVRTAIENDPAARSVAATLTYPGLHAVWLHRLAHWLWAAGFCFTARVLSQVSRLLTGVEIHPAATLGRRVFIDHGMGVVIGETAEVGDDVHLFHGVTLGGNDPRPVDRHPTVEDGATLGANATIVGDITVGEGATVGAGAVVVDDVPARVTVAGNPAEIVDDPRDVSEQDANDEEATETTAAEPVEPSSPGDRVEEPARRRAGRGVLASLRPGC
jgi:serine O-acetyltransferase